MPTKFKEPSFWSDLVRKPTGPKKAQGATEKDPKADNRPSIAERINFGGRYPDKSKGPKSN